MSIKRRKYVEEYRTPHRKHRDEAVDQLLEKNIVESRMRIRTAFRTFSSEPMQQK